MQTRLYINNELCHNLTQLQEHLKGLSYGSEVFSDILEYALFGDLSNWLREHGYEDLGNKIDSLDQSASDSEYMSQLANLLTDKTSSISKPRYTNCFSCDISIPTKSSKEVVVQLSITPKSFINENFEIKVSCAWGTKARMFNPSQHEGNTDHKESVSFHRRTNKEIGKIVVSIENEQVFEESVQLPNPKPETSVQSSSGTPRDEFVSFLKESNAPQSISDIVSWAERASQIKKAKKSLIECDNIKASNPKSPKTPEYIRTIGGPISKEEWITRRAQEQQALKEKKRRAQQQALKEKKRRAQEEQQENEKSIERFRRKHWK